MVLRYVGGGDLEDGKGDGGKGEECGKRGPGGAG